MARNTGIEAGVGDYVLFLDDDIIPEPDLLGKYVKAVEKWPDSVGFIGTVDFPRPENSFERGVVASDILTFFGIAKSRKESTWGVTANLLVKRDAIGPIKFSKAFPVHGGGEDIDFCLRIVQRTGKRFLTLPEAAVHHPWWGDGRRQYRRFGRWAYGDSQLPQLHPQYRYLNLPNMAESGFLGLLLFMILAPLHPRFAWDAAGSLVLAVLSECVVESFRAIRSGRGSIRTGVESALVRLSNEIGRLVGNIRRGHVSGICERFDYFTTGESKAFERKVAALKLGVFISALSILTVLVR